MTMVSKCRKNPISLSFTNLFKTLIIIALSSIWTIPSFVQSDLIAEDGGNSRIENQPEFDGNQYESYVNPDANNQIPKNNQQHSRSYLSAHYTHSPIHLTHLASIETSIYSSLVNYEQQLLERLSIIRRYDQYFTATEVCELLSKVPMADQLLLTK
jgi:hypothetical protein